MSGEPKPTLLMQVRRGAPQLTSRPIFISYPLSAKQQKIVEALTGKKITELSLTENEVADLQVPAGKTARLGIICAFGAEAELIKAQLKNVSSEKKNFRRFDSGELQGVPVVVTVTGPGKVNAALTAETMFSSFTIGQLILTGVAGGLSSLPIGSLVVSDVVKYHDYGQMGAQGIVRSPVPVKFPPDEETIVLEHFDADPTLVESVKQAVASINLSDPPPGQPQQIPQLAVAGIATGDQFVCGNDARDLIGKRTGCVAVDMESAAVAHVAYLNQVPFVIVRSLSDRADVSSQLDFPQFEVWAAHRSAQVVCSFAQSAGKKRMKPVLLFKGGLQPTTEERPVVLEIELGDEHQNVVRKVSGVGSKVLAFSVAELLRVVSPERFASQSPDA